MYTNSSRRDIPINGAYTALLKYKKIKRIRCLQNYRYSFYQGKLTKKGKLFVVFRIRIEFNADLGLDPTFKLNEHLAERKVDEDNKKVDGNKLKARVEIIFFFIAVN